MYLNNIKHEKCELYNDFTQSLILMVFDTETTGIVKGWTYGAPLDNQPYITQLSYVLFNEQTKESEFWKSYSNF